MDMDDHSLNGGIRDEDISDEILQTEVPTGIARQLFPNITDSPLADTYNNVD